MTGFNSKRDAAADKLQEPVREALKLALDALIWTTGSGDFGEGGYAHEGAKKCLFPAIAAIQEALAQPAQEPVARVSGVYGGRFTYEPLNRAMILPVGMALYAGPT